MAIEPVSADLSGRYDGVLITSSNAARAVAGNKKQPAFFLPAFAVGANSATAAREAGFDKVISAEGDAGDLLRLVAARYTRPASLLYLAGEDRAVDVAAALEKSGISVHTAVVYRTVGLPLSPALREALKRNTLHGVLHFSARSAQFYLDGAGSAGLLAQALRPRHYCLSSQVSAPLAKAAAPYVAIAARPNERALLECIEQ
jgi:uroporphyrinogen-III synthase